MPQWEIILRGRVQGVGFRHLAKKYASRLGLRGYVRNLPDGSVRIIAEAEDDLIDIYCEFLRRGNVFSRVDSLNSKIVEKPKEYNDFEII